MDGLLPRSNPGVYGEFPCSEEHGVTKTIDGVTWTWFRMNWHNKTGHEAQKCRGWGGAYWGHPPDQAESPLYPDLAAGARLQDSRVPSQKHRRKRNTRLLQRIGQRRVAPDLYVPRPLQEVG